MGPFDSTCDALGSMALISASTRLVPCPYYDSFASKSSSYAFASDATGHASNYVPTTRTWSNSTFVAGLSNNRSTEEKEALVEEMFRRYEARVAVAPLDHAMDYTHAYLHVEKMRK